ncbi:MAG: hypothetical protein HN778_19160 [Prolixibacteraceae bacterium]|jgi:hypothetical protein|nr:hypothetical protein [Prolixibacteraceae bacterium]MBT6006360.1 hypothetical protein [Prolixibacteraceae bacterium]MBT6765297.1 hypothetical protein [Prolixibacteraceae bacterium]MBT6996915.1 hypothetical protein [Prolixibacteraceae bacterium]MBT7396957.1 hypothetical protein [Prolixibacteraceae bacterium]
MKLKAQLSKYSIIFSVVLISSFTIIKGYWKDENRVIISDVINYYAYLPATFIFHDIGITKVETIEKGKFWTKRLSNGNNIIKMSMGMSFVYAPFFFAGHGAAKILGYEAYGYSEPYKFALIIGAIIYLILGLIFLRKILLKYFSDKITTLTILAIAIGTNLAYYSSVEGTMTHIYNFAFFNIFIWHTILWHEKPTFKRLFGLGALAGLITLIRPSNIVILLFFFIYNVYSFRLIKEKITFVYKKFHWFLGMLLAFLLVWIPQFAYNLYFTGDLLFYSYTGEKFFFNNPQILDGLFSYRKGWLLYTPMMIISIFGMIVLFFKKKEFSWATLIFMIISVYIIFSWWCWWYGGSFGQRPFVDFYGMLAIPFALLLTELARIKKWVYHIAVALVFVLIVLNNFQMQKYLKGSLHFADTTKEAYWHSFWHIRPQPGFFDLLETPDYKKAKEGIFVVQPKD